MVSNVKGGSQIAGIEVLSVSMTYNGQNYSSTASPDNGVKGWVIAVAVVGGIIGLILVIVIISCIYKKVK